jgi:DNA-binding transcriptional LysR family regulator
MNDDWNDLRALLAVARAGSLSSAARASGMSQPTLSRRIAALEARLGVTLFVRGAGGARPTDAAVGLIEHAEAMEAAAARLALAAAGRAQAVEGTVRVTASQVVAVHHLPAILADLMEAEPGLEIELVSSNDTGDLLRREADIAVRMHRPEQADVVARKLGDFRLGLYAARAYTSRHGAPETAADLRAHRFVGYDRSDLILRGFARAGVDVPRNFFRLRTDDQVANWQAVRAGAGIGAMQRAIGDADPAVLRVLPDTELQPMPCWLAAHEELRGSRRVRVVFDFLAERLRALIASQPA